MRTIAIACSVLAGLALLVMPASALVQDGEDAPRVAAIGKAAPPFELEDADGRQRSLSSYKGKIVVLEWIDTNCEFVQTIYRNGTMQDAYKAARAADESVVWLAINSTRTATRQQNKFWVQEHKLAYPILLDAAGVVGRRYDARRTPHMFVIDAEGVLRYHGAIDDNQLLNKEPGEVNNYVVEAVKRLAAGEDVEPSETKPYGCTVKYQR